MVENLGLFILYAITSGLGLTFLKQGFLGDILHMRNIGIFGAVLYLVSFGIWLRIVARTEIIVAYPIAVGLSFLSLSIFSASIAGVRISPTQAVGMGVILGGIAIAIR